MVGELFEKLPSWLKKPDPNIYLGDNYVTIDYETTTINSGSPYDNRNSIVCASWSTRESRSRNKIYFAWGNEFQLQRLERDISKADFIVSFNAGFEVGWNERIGIRLREHPLVFDSQLAEWVIAGNRGFGRRASLNKALTRAGLPGKEDLVSLLIKKGVNTTEIPRRWLKHYSLQDVASLDELFKRQLAELTDLKLLPVCFTRNILVIPKVSIEQKGLHLDQAAVEKVFKYYDTKLRKLNIEWEQFTGGLNAKSAKQKREYIYGVLKFDVPERGYTDKGEPSTDKNVLVRLKPRNKKQKRFLELQKELALVIEAHKNISKLKDCCDETKDQTLYIDLNQCTTQNHRLSSSGRDYKVQGQNITRDFKPCFSARKDGWLVAEHDQSGLEFKTAVDITRCPVGMASIERQEDPHELTAKIIFRGDYDESQPAKSLANKDFRQEAKSHTFKPLYGGSSGSEREREYYAAFREKFSGINEAQEGWKDEVLRTGQLRIPSGLIFYWPDTKITRSGYITNTSMICNYPVSSFATADIVPIGVTYQWYLMQYADMQSFMINTIHDSAISEINPEERELYSNIAVYSHSELTKWYLKEVYDWDFKVPLEVEETIERNWNYYPEWETKWQIQ